MSENALILPHKFKHWEDKEKGKYFLVPNGAPLFGCYIGRLYPWQTDFCWSVWYYFSHEFEGLNGLALDENGEITDAPSSVYCGEFNTEQVAIRTCELWAENHIIPWARPIDKINEVLKIGKKAETCKN